MLARLARRWWSWPMNNFLNLLNLRWAKLLELSNQHWMLCWNVWICFCFYSCSMFTSVNVMPSISPSISQRRGREECRAACCSGAEKRSHGSWVFSRTCEWAVPGGGQTEDGRAGSSGKMWNTLVIVTVFIRSFLTYYCGPSYKYMYCNITNINNVILKVNLIEYLK